jgi:hypothetical protein
VQTNLSVDRKPPTGFVALAQTNELQFSAAMGTARFADLIRRGAIVNSGGFWLASKDATLKQRILDVEDPKPVPKNPEDQRVTGPATDVRALLLITFKKDLANLSVANALRVGYTAVSKVQAEGLASFARDFNAGDRTPVIVAGKELSRDPVPGTLPLRISVPHTARLYPSLADGAAIGATFEEFVAEQARLLGEPAPAATPVEELLSRFNLLEYAVADGGDGMFRQIYCQSVRLSRPTRSSSARMCPASTSST